MFVLEIKPNQIRLGEHSDYCTMSLVFQRDTGGLQVKVCVKSIIIFYAHWYFIPRGLLLLLLRPHDACRQAFTFWSCSF